MPRYLATRHAIQRLVERLPGITTSLVELADRAVVVAQQAGMDLMLCVDVGLERIYLPVTPRPCDTWTIRTVLTEAQAMANLASHADEARATWRVQKGFARPFARRRAHTTVLTEAA